MSNLEYVTEPFLVTPDGLVSPQGSLCHEGVLATEALELLGRLPTRLWQTDGSYDQIVQRAQRRFRRRNEAFRAKLGVMHDQGLLVWR